MAKYRYVHTSFWQDAKVLEEMTPEDKYFYIYLLTNPNTTQIGIYQITKKQMAFDLGYSIETVNSLMRRFEEIHKVIKYNQETREIALINWGKYNLIKGGKPILDCIKKELTEVKDTSFITLIAQKIPNEGIKEIFLRYVDDTSDDTVSTRGEKEAEKEKEKEAEKEAEKEKFAADVQALLNRYVELRAYGFDPSPKDIEVAKEIIGAGIDVNYAIKWLEEKFNSYIPKHSKDRINSLEYCAGYIFDQQFKLLEQKGDVNNDSKIHQHSRCVGRSPGKSAEQALREAEEARKAWGG